MRDSKAPGMTLIVKTITRLTVGLILIYGVFVTLSGHDGPGGGFAGGVIIALSFIHLMLAFGREACLKKFTHRASINWAAIGALLFCGLTVWRALAGPGINLALGNIAELVVAAFVGAGFFAVFVALVLLTGAMEEEK